MEKALQAFDSNIEIHGDKSHGYFATLKHESCSGAAVGLRECQFCKGNRQRVVNTTTDSYWIECACGIQLNSDHIDDDGGSYSDIDCGHSFSGRAECLAAHKKAFLHVVNKWNSLGAASGV